MLQDRYSPRNNCRTFQAMSFEGIAFFHALRSIFSLKREALQAIPFFPLTPGRAAQGRPLALPYRPCLPPGAKIFPAPFASRFTSLHKNSIVEPHNVCAGFIHDEESRCKGISGSRKQICCRKMDIDNHFSRQRHENTRSTLPAARYSEKNPSEDGGLEDI